MFFVVFFKFVTLRLIFDTFESRTHVFRSTVQLLLFASGRFYILTNGR